MNNSSINEEIRDKIRNVGLRATPARVLTLNLLGKAQSPLSHADVAKELSKSSIDKATAFRSLNDMTSAGLLRRTELGDHVWRFELIGDDEHDSSHPHFLCTDCGKLSCLDDVKLTAKSVRESLEVGTVTDILLRGQCHECG